jgi:hypothetical protein
MVELLAWLISAALAIWMVQDMVRVSRGHDEASLVNAPDPLEEPFEPPAGSGKASA